MFQRHSLTCNQQIPFKLQMYKIITDVQAFLLLCSSGRGLFFAALLFITGGAAAGVAGLARLTDPADLVSCTIHIEASTGTEAVAVAQRAAASGRHV